MADRMLIDGLIKFCDEKSKNIKLKAEPQVFIEIAMQLEKLKLYKDAEEQGLLLRLPCPIGSTIWKFEYPTKVDENGDEWTILDKKRATVAPLKFALCHLDSIGTLYFVTREEAEQALEQMKAGGIDG